MTGCCKHVSGLSGSIGNEEFVMPLDCLLPEHSAPTDAYGHAHTGMDADLYK
jgi:hypothetical protein